MKIEEIFSEWEVDSEIDRTRLDNDAVNTYKLHYKYHKIYTAEKLILYKRESEMKKLKFDKYEFYSQGPNEETISKGWVMPSKGMILKSDIPIYMEGDNDIIELSLKIGIQKEKVALLESIIKSIGTRNFTVKNANDFIRWTSGN